MATAHSVIQFWLFLTFNISLVSIFGGLNKRQMFFVDESTSLDDDKGTTQKILKCLVL